MDFNDLTESQKAKARECKTPEELVALAESEGFELTDEQLEAVAGGSEWSCQTERCEGYDCSQLDIAR